MGALDARICRVFGGGAYGGVLGLLCLLTVSLQKRYRSRMESTKAVQVNGIKLSGEVHAWLRSKAIENRRSLVSEIAYRLETAVRAEKIAASR